MCAASCCAVLSTGALGWRVYSDGEREREEKSDELRSALSGRGQDVTTDKPASS